jgi:ParB family transcriptional regulator, chromosome partitioning protein
LSSKKAAVTLTAYEDLFSSEAERQEVGREQVQNVPLELFHPFPNHPFKVLDDEKMQDTVQSISEFGVLVPVLARPRPEGGYEIVSGHRRIHASELAGRTKVPAIIRNMTDDEAILIMVDSNLQREQILPSEKAFAYKMKLEAMKRQGRRTDLTSSQIGTRLRSDEIIAAQTGDSRNQIARFIRLTHLISPILDMVDQNSFALNAAVEISYLPEGHQNTLLEAMDYAQVSPSLAQARRIRAFSDSGKLDANVLDAILSEEKPLERKVTLRGDKLQKFFPSSYTPLQMEKVITQLLEDWSRKQKERTDHGR